jgi:nucleoside-triphosphatase THEP1
MTNRKPSRSGALGYPYQQYVYSLFVAKMDVDEKFVCVETEKYLEDSSISNFDDCYLEYDSNKYYFQVKNRSKNGKKATLEDIKFHDGKITLFGSDMKFNKENKNILVVYTDKIQTNTQILGLNAVLKNGIYIVPLTIQDISNYMDDLFSDENRARVITEFALEKTSSGIFKITKHDLPLPQKLFSHELEEETRILRGIIPEIETGILMVIGKPGVGKSHFVNEITGKIKPDSLYRFWISSTDEDMENRLQFNNFIKELCIDVFKSSAKFSENQLIDKINSEELTIIVDGLDHIENYNPHEFNKFVEFINKCQNGKILVLSRPLKNDLDWDYINLENWDYDETKKYFEEEIWL